MATGPTDRLCAIDPNIGMRCSVQAGRKVWQGVSRDNVNIAKTTCPSDSMPWRSRLVCDHAAGEFVRTPRCFTTTIEEYNMDAAVCITAGEHSGMHPTDRAISGVRNVRPVSHDRPADSKDIESRFTACYLQPYADMGRDAVMVSYVPKGESEKCRLLRDDAIDACRRTGASTDDCHRRVKHIYKDENEKPYACTLDTRNLPVAHEHDRGEWWRWMRHNRYSCRGKGWSCDDPELREYEGGRDCTRDTECAAAFESGICDVKKGVCATGTAKGTRCSTHEQCDHVGFVSGRCDMKQKKCVTGHTETGASYYAPKECTPIPKQRHTFCGKMQTAEGERFSGVCMPYDYDGHTFYGCKAFDDEAEIERISADERDHQAQTHSANFSESHLDWDKLTVCPREDTVEIGGKRVCMHTTHTVHMQGRTISAVTDEDATQKCAASRCDEACTPGMCARDPKDGTCAPSKTHAVATRSDQEAPTPAPTRAESMTRTGP